MEEHQAPPARKERPLNLSQARRGKDAHGLPKVLQRQHLFAELAGHHDLLAVRLARLQIPTRDALQLPLGACQCHHMPQPQRVRIRAGKVC